VQAAALRRDDAQVEGVRMVGSDLLERLPVLPGGLTCGGDLPVALGILLAGADRRKQVPGMIECGPQEGDSAYNRLDNSISVGTVAISAFHSQYHDLHVAGCQWPQVSVI
jgi:hypothetical protein